MSQQAMHRNPFMLMIDPEVVLAAVAKSERLSQLNRHLCRPLDRPSPTAGADGGVELEEASELEEGADGR